jgi:RNase P/RNase MRP subunit p29
METAPGIYSGNVVIGWWNRFLKNTFVLSYASRKIPVPAASRTMVIGIRELMNNSGEIHKITGENYPMNPIPEWSATCGG